MSNSKLKIDVTYHILSGLLKKDFEIFYAYHILRYRLETVIIMGTHAIIINNKFLKQFHKTQFIEEYRQRTSTRLFSSSPLMSLKSKVTT